MLPITAVIIWVVMGAQGTVRVLDLTRGPDAVDPKIAPYNMVTCGSMAKGTGRSVGTPPFALAIEAFDKAEYSMGGPIVVDLKLTNTSDQTVSIPTVLVDQFWEAYEGEESITFGFTILIKDASGAEHEVVGVALRGSTKLPDTIQSLGPGESIRIHYPGYIPITDVPGIPRREGRMLALLVVSDGACRWWDIVRSEAVGKVRLKGR